MQGRTVRSTRLHRKRDLRPRHRLRLQMLLRRHRQGLQKLLHPGRTAPQQRDRHLSRLLPNLHLLRPSAILFTGYVGRVEKSMGCIAMAAIHAVRPSTPREISMSTPRIGYARIAKTKYPSSGPCVIVESGGREAHRSSITARLQRTASSQKGLRPHGLCSTGERWSTKELDWAWRNLQQKGHTRHLHWTRSAQQRPLKRLW